MMPASISFARCTLGCVVLLALAACSSAPSPSGSSAGAPAAGTPGPVRTVHDGPPSYMQDVSQIPDAVPVPHTGRYKATPYSVLGRDYNPMQDGRSYREEGVASWYGTKFHGQNTANGELYDLYGMTAAHKTLPLPTYVQVTNLENNRTIIVRVNDRGPFYSDRIIDLSYAAAKKLGYADQGTARVRVQGIDPVAWQQQNNPSYLVQSQPPVAAPITEIIPPEPVETGHTGYYLQVGAFSNAQSAEQLRQRLRGVVTANVFVSEYHDQTRTLHRVRLGPVSSQDEARQLMETLRLANMGTPTLVTVN
ncbi:MAG: septal ring lytic transglycosylase RlpA family protein [Halopseudomonas sp.]|uniref:septal ring lytic transglycosylase RlpA family protein n=1 Tax=Halopseudomonas sp. TaxID=2901191 RepID=UPI0030012BC9